SFEVKVMKNHRPIVPLQKISLGITPITGENVWEIVSSARENITSLKAWLENYIIFKGIKLRWSAVNIACSVLNTVPDLTGDVFAQVTQNTTINLTPMGLIPFNAILIIDISRSMMARDVFATNIAPAIEGIKAAMESREIQEFLKHFKPNINVPRRIAAAFAAVLFLSEKVGRGFGEKVAVIRFADEAQILPFGNSFYIDSASGKKGVLEDAARMIVDRIANAYGQATNMGAALLAAHQILNEFEKMNPDQPTMIVLLTDGEPTDGDAFFENIKLFAQKSNVILYIVGLGNPNDELMTKAAQLCGGEYFKPADAGELLVWYSKRARDLTVKLKAHREEV
ncbi:MAG: vWA domain-containing protein, partial [Promethearchaeota archaeon]